MLGGNDYAACTKIGLDEVGELKGSNFAFFDFQNTWIVNDGDYPTLKKNGLKKEDSDLVALDGEGTINNPYLIKTVNDLASISNAHHYFSSHFRLENDLDFNGVNVSQIQLAIDTKKVGFTGAINGNGKTISNINLVGNDNGGRYALIPYIDGAKIENVKFENINVSGTQYNSFLTAAWN